MRNISIRQAVAVATLLSQFAAPQLQAWDSTPEQHVISIGIVTLNGVPSGQQTSASVVTDPENYVNVPGLRVIAMELRSTASAAATIDGLVIETSDGKKQPADTPFSWIPRIDTPTETIRILVRDQPDHPVAIGSLPVVPATRPEQPSAPNCTMPVVATSGGVQVIHGDTGGNSREMAIAIDGLPAKIVAAKPGSVFWRIPDNVAPGPHQVVFSPGSGKETVVLPMFVAGLKMTADQLHLIRGQSTRMVVTVTGLENLPESAWQFEPPPPDLVDLDRSIRSNSSQRGTLVLVIENQSPQTIRMGKYGTPIVLHLQQRDFRNGPYVYEDHVQSLQTGSFDIRGTLTAFLKQSEGRPKNGGNDSATGAAEHPPDQPTGNQRHGEGSPSGKTEPENTPLTNPGGNGTELSGGSSAPRPNPDQGPSKPHDRLLVGGSASADDNPQDASEKVHRKTQPSPAPKIVLIGTNDEPVGESVVKSQTFRIHAVVPDGSKQKEIAVNVKNQDGTTRSVSLPYDRTSAFGAEYWSEPIQIEGRMWDWISVKNAGVLTAEMQVNGQTAEASVTVYDTDAKQAIGRNESVIDAFRAGLPNVIMAAAKVAGAIDQKLPTIKDEAIREKLRKERARVIEAKAVAEAKLEVVLAYDESVRWGTTHDKGPVYLFTDQFKVRLGLELIPLLTSPRDFDFNARMTTGTRTIIREAVQRAHDKAEEDIANIKHEALKLVALGLYQASATLSLAGPAFTMASPVISKLAGGSFTGTTIWNTEAKGEDYIHAATELLLAVAMMKGIPVAVDAMGNAAVTGSTGPISLGEVVITGGGACEPAKAPVPVVRPPGISPEIYAEAKFSDALVETGLKGLAKRAAQAKAAGADPCHVDQILQEAVQQVNSEPGMKEIVLADFELGQLTLYAKDPRAIPVNTRYEALVRTVRTKAAIEIREPGAQTWTPQEYSMLQWIAGRMELMEHVYFVDDPLATGGDIAAGIDEHGFEPVIGTDDAANIRKVADTRVRIAEAPPGTPRPPAPSPAVSQVGAADRQAGGQPGVRTAKGDTKVLAPGENPYTNYNHGAPDPLTGASPRQRGVKLKGLLEIGDLRDEFVNNQAVATRKAERFKESPIDDTPRRGEKSDFETMPPENLKQLTKEEVRRIPPDIIRRMPPELRRALPMDKLNAEQVAALLDAVKHGAPETGRSPTAPLGGTDLFPESAKMQSGYTRTGVSYHPDRQPAEEAVESRVTGASQWPSSTDASRVTIFTSPDKETILTVYGSDGWTAVAEFKRIKDERLKEVLNRPLGEDGESKKGDSSTPGTPPPGAIPLPPNSQRRTTLTVENHCQTPQQFEISTEGLPKGMLQSGEAIRINGSATAPFPLIFDTSNVPPGTYSGSIVVKCLTCGPRCKADRSAFPIQLFVSPLITPGDAAPLNGQGGTKPNRAADFKHIPGSLPSVPVVDRKGDEIGYLIPGAKPNCKYSWEPARKRPDWLMVSYDNPCVDVRDDGSVWDIKTGERLGQIQQ